MSYKAFKGKWQAFGDKPIISMPPGALQPPAGCSRPVLCTGLSTGLICFNKACYDTFIKPTNCKYVKLYYEPDMKKVAFTFRNDRKGEFVLPVNLTKTGVLAVVNGKTFFNQFGIKYPEQSRSFPVHQTKPSSGINGIEIKLTEYMSNR